MRNGFKRASVIGIATVALAGAGVASAAWMAESYLNASGQTATLAAATGSATIESDLFPGEKGDLTGSLTNPNRVPVKVIIDGVSGIDSECASLAGGPGALGDFELGAHETKTVQMLNVVKLADDAPDTCQNVSFTVRLHTQTTAGN
ncbi:hypothetical protein [Actinopolymorpha pittospori]